MGTVKGISANSSLINNLNPITREMNITVEKIQQIANERQEEIEELALEEDDVITDIEEGEADSDDFSKRIKEQDPDLKELNSQLKGAEDLLKSYEDSIKNKPKDFESMKTSYESAINATIYYSQKEGYVVKVDEEKQKKIKTEYAKYAKEHGYDSMLDMIKYYDSCDIAIKELEACKKVLNKQIDCKYHLIDYTCKYGILAEKEDYGSSGEIRTFHMFGSGYIVPENDDVDPLQKHIDACNAGSGAYSDVGQEIVELYEASQNDPSLGKMYQYIYKHEGKEAANKYLEDLAPYIRQSAAVYEASQFIDSIKGVGDIEEIAKKFKEGFGDGMDSFFEGLGNLASPLEDYSTLDYKKIYVLYALTNNPEFGEFSYEIGLGAGNLTVPLAVGLLVPGGGSALAGGLLSGASVAGNTTHNCIVNGMDLNIARAEGALAGTVDTATWILGGRLNKLCKAKFAKSWAEFTVFNAGMAGTLGGMTFVVQVNEKADQLLKTGDYLQKYPNDREAATRAAYNDAYEALGGDMGFLKKIGFAAGAGGIVGGISYGKVKADAEIANQSYNKKTQDIDEVIGSKTTSKNNVGKVEGAGASIEANSVSSDKVISGLDETIEATSEAASTGFVINQVQLDTASSILSYIKSMNGSVDTNNEKEN